MIRIARAYEVGAKRKGEVRLLVDRLWPRGLRREALALDAWVKDVAPSTELRKWFGHDPARWTEFRRRYRKELACHPERWKALLPQARQHDVVLLFGARDVEHNHAVVLRDFLREKLRR
jgi:uncharacterized protein YeaO (DUF488 family)